MNGKPHAMYGGECNATQQRTTKTLIPVLLLVQAARLHIKKTRIGTLISNMCLAAKPL
jgi:hypothetical protein